MAGAVGFEPQTKEELEEAAWQGPEPEAATRFKEFMGQSLLFPKLSERVEQRIRIAQDRPETGEGAIDPWEAMRLGAAGAPAAPYQFHTPGEIEAGITLGTTDLVEQMTQPANLAFIAAIPFAFRVPALAAMAEAGISVGILKHVLEVSPEVIELWKTGQIEQAVRLTTNIALELPIAFFTGRSAIRRTRGGLIDPIIDLRGRRAAEAAAREKPVVRPTERATEQPGAPQIEPEVPIDVTAREVVPGEPAVTFEGARPLRPRETRPRVEETGIVPEDRLRGLTAEPGVTIGPRLPRRTPEQLREQEEVLIDRELEWAEGKVAEGEAAEALVTPEGTFSVRKMPGGDPVTGEWGVFIDGELDRTFRIEAAARDFAEIESKRIIEDYAEVEPDVTPEGQPAAPDLPVWSYSKEGNRWEVYKQSPGENRIMVDSFKTEKQAAARIADTMESQKRLVESRAEPTVEPTPPREDQTKVDVFEPGVVEGQTVYLPEHGKGKVLSVTSDDTVWVRFTGGFEANFPIEEAIRYRSAPEAARAGKPGELLVKEAKDFDPEEGEWGVFRRGEPGANDALLKQFKTETDARWWLDQQGKKAKPRIVWSYEKQDDGSFGVFKKTGDAAPVLQNAFNTRREAIAAIAEGIGKPEGEPIDFKGTQEAAEAEEFPERVGIKPEPTVAPEARPAAERIRAKGKGVLPTEEGPLTTGATVWFKGKKKGMVSTLTADGKKAKVIWDPMAGGGERTVLVSNLSTKPPEGEVAAPPERKVGIRAGQKETIELGKGRGGVPRGIQIERDTEGNIMARVMATGEPTGTGSKWIEIEGKKVAEAREKVFLDAKREFIRDKLKATNRNVKSTTEAEQKRSVFWNEESDLILKLEPDTAPRTEIVATETIEAGDLKVGPTYEYAIRPDAVQGRLGWLPVMRGKGETWEPAGMGRVPNITARNYDEAVSRIHDALADRATSVVKFTDPRGIELEATRLEEIEAAKTAEELERATAEKQFKAAQDKAAAKAKVARQVFKEITPTEKPKFVAAVQHRKVLKPLHKHQFTIVKDGIATSTDGSITIMTRTDLADGVYSPFVQGENKIFRKLQVAPGVLAEGPLPVAAEGKQGRITIEAKSNDLKRIQRILKGVTPGRYALNSFQVERANPSEIRVIATDGHRLLINTIPFEGKIKEGENWLVDGRALELILKEKKGTKIELLLDEDTVSLIGQNIAVSNKREGTFPNWEAVVPKTIEHELAINKKALSDILEKAKVEMLDNEPWIVYFTRTPEGLDVQVEYDVVTKLEEIATTYGPESKEYKEQVKKHDEGFSPEKDLIPKYGSIGSIPFVQRKPDMTKSKSEITVQMPIQGDPRVTTSEFNYNRKYLEDIIAGVRDDTLLLGLTVEPDKSQAVFTGTLEPAPEATKYKYPTRGQKSAAQLMAEPPEKFSAYIKKQSKADMARSGQLSPATNYAQDLGYFLDGALASKPIMPEVLQVENRGLRIEDKVKQWYDERNQEAQALKGEPSDARRDPGAGAMVEREPAVDAAAIQRIGDKAGATEQHLDRALSRKWIDEQHLEDWFAAQKVSGPDRIKMGSQAKARALERQKGADLAARKAAGEPIVEAEGLTGEERLLQAIGKPQPPRGGRAERNLGPDVRPVRGPGQQPLGRAPTKATKEAPVLKPRKMTLEEIRDESLQLQTAQLKTMGEGAMAGRLDRPGPPGRKPPPPLPPKPPAVPPPPGAPPPEPPGAALEAAKRMVSGQDPLKPGFWKRVTRFPETLQRLFTSEFQPLKHAEDRIYREQSKELPLLNMARKFELQAGAHGKAALDVLLFQEKVNDLLPKGKGQHFNVYVALERIRARLIDNPKVKRVEGWTIERADTAIRELQMDMTSPDFETIRAVAHNEYQEVMDTALRLQVTTGRMTEKMYKDIKKANPFYAPFKVLQLLEEGEGLPGTGRNIATTQAYTRAIKGIDQDDFVIENILEESARMVYRSRILAEKNLKMLELDKLMQMGGKENPFKKADPDRFYQIHYKPAEDILHQLAMQETARTGRQTLEHSLMKVGRAIELADSVGITLKKRNLISSLGRATIGGVDTRGKVNLMAFTSDVIAHELGHSFDVPLRDQRTGKIITKEKKVFGQERNIVQRLSTVINLRKGSAFGKQGKFQKELAELVKFTKLGGTPQYRAKAVERFAEFVNLYIHDPKQARKLAPQWTDYFEKEILPHQKIKQLVERLGSFFQEADKLPNIMDEIKDMGGLKYIELAIRRAFPERKPQLGVRFGTRTKPGEEILQYFKEGKRQAMLTDTVNARAVRGLHREEATQVAKVLSAASMPMRLGATAANAAFQTVNLLAADLPRAALMSRYGIRNPKDIYRFPGDWVYSFYTAIGGNFGFPNKLYKDFLGSGLANSAVQRAITPKAFDPTVERNWMMSVLDTVPKLSSAIEETSKILGLKRAFRIEDIEKYEMGSPERQEIMDYMVSELRNYSGSPDFLRRGQLLSGAGTNLNLLYIFLNARIQGVVGDLGRLMGATGKKEAGQAWARLSPWLLAMTALALWNRMPGNREDHEKRADWELENYFMFYRNNPDGTPMYITNSQGEKIRAAYRWPKREVTQLLGNFIEASIEFADKRDPEALRDYAVSFLENISPVSISGNNMQERVESVASGLNPAFKVPLEFGLGRDTFRHRRVVPMYIQGVPSRSLSPMEQYTTTTPQQYITTSRYLKEAFDVGISPMILEQMVRGASAGLITQFTPRARPGRSKVLELPIIGPIASRYVGSEYLGTEPDELLEAAVLRQGDRRVNITRKAEQIHEAWVAEDPEPPSLRDFVRLQGGTEEHWLKVQDIMSDIRLGLTYNERIMKTLQIGNGERALYLAEKAVAEYPDGPERSAWFRDLQQKKILTPEVVPRMNAEIRRLEGGEPTVQPEQ